MKALFCGDRNWSDKEIIRQVMLYLRDHFPDLEIIEGEAKGADRLSQKCAKEENIPYHPFPAQWNIYGLAAGPIRNQRMITIGHPDIVLAFHHNLLESVGTKNMVSLAMKAGIPVWVCTEGFDPLAVITNKLKKCLMSDALPKGNL